MARARNTASKRIKAALKAKKAKERLRKNHQLKKRRPGGRLTRKLRA